MGIHFTPVTTTGCGFALFSSSHYLTPLESGIFQELSFSLKSSNSGSDSSKRICCSSRCAEITILPEMGIHFTQVPPIGCGLGTSPPSRTR